MNELMAASPACHVPPPTNLDRLIRRGGLTLIAWSDKRAAWRAMRIENNDKRLSILDPDVPRAARAILPPPGLFR